MNDFFTLIKWLFAIWTGDIIEFLRKWRKRCYCILWSISNGAAKLFLPEIDEQSLQHKWFQQDGSHTARATMEILREAFPKQIMLKSDDIDRFRLLFNWFNSFSIFFSYLKEKVYANKLTTIQQLKHNICEEIDQIIQEICNEKCNEKCCRERVCICTAARADHLADIIFHN